MDEWQGLTHTIVVPGMEQLDAVIAVMIRAEQTFGVRPALRPGFWLVGLTPQGVDVFAQVLLSTPGREVEAESGEESPKDE